MKKLFLIILLLSSSAFAQWTEVQKAWNSTAGISPATTTVSLPSVGANHVVVASVEFLGTATGFTMTVSDGNGHNFTATPNSPCIYTAGEKVWLFYLIGTVSGNMTVTATPSVAHGLSIHAIEFSPAIGNPTFDTDSCANPSSGTTPINTPSVTPVRAGMLYAAAISDPNSTGAVSAAGTGWTLGTNGTIASDAGQSADEYQLSTTGATSANWTVTGSSGSGWVAMEMSITSVQIPSVRLKGTTRFKGKVILK